MRTFNYEVTGCHNCPHNYREAMCSKSVFVELEDYTKLAIENYFILTPSCPEYSKTINNGWNKYPDTHPDLEFVDADWQVSKQCLVSDGENVTLASLNSNEYGTLWQGSTMYLKDEITHWKYTDLP